MFGSRCQQIGYSTIKIHRPVSFLGSLVLPINYQSTRLITTTNFDRQNHYESLGISSSSTQNDIKTAYYNLSKIYHPDKNQGSEEAAKKFREITRAYEVLSNYRLRRLYDKGIIHTAGEQYTQTEEINRDIVEDDPQTKFYKSRFHKSKVTTSQGQAPIYNFDEWARAHYGQSFDRRQKAKVRYERKVARDISNEFSGKNEIAIFGVVLGVTIFYLIASTERSYDTPKAADKEKQKISEAK